MYAIMVLGEELDRQYSTRPCHPGSKVNIKLQLAGPVCIAFSTEVYCAAGRGRHTYGLVIAPVRCWYCRFMKSTKLSFDGESKIAITHELNVFS